MAWSGAVPDIRVDRRDISCQSDFEKNKVHDVCLNNFFILIKLLCLITPQYVFDFTLNSIMRTMKSYCPIITIGMFHNKPANIKLTQLTSAEEGNKRI